MPFNPTRPILFLVTAIALVGCETPIHYPEGGYDYPKHYTARDTEFYYYPLKGVLSRKDSFHRAAAFFYFRHLKEPNLSIKYYGKDVFRLVYSITLGDSYVITLTRNEITVKKPEPDYYKYVYYDNYSSLTKTEQYLLMQLERRFPFDGDDYKDRPLLRKRIDSLIKLYPQLLDVNYYWSLVSKKLAPIKDCAYSCVNIPITTKDFEHIVTVINASGYWKMPYEINCDSPPFDGDGFSLEANTVNKYNYVEFGSCVDHKPMQLKFENACQELIKYAKLDKEISALFDGETTMAPVDSSMTPRPKAKGVKKNK